MKKNLLLALAILALSLAPSATHLFAGDAPPVDGSVKASECDTDAMAYAHGALTNFHGHLCHINVHFPGQAEEFLEKLVVKLGMNPDLTTLAADGTATVLTGGTYEGKTIAGTVAKVVARSTFFGVYDYVAIVTVDSVTQATMYWSGKGKDSKGFLIMGGKRIVPPKRGGGSTDTTNLLYVKWDRTTAAQTVDVLGTRFVDSYLHDTATDDAIHGAVTYDTGTKATTVQVVELGKRRVGTSPTFACWRMYATGISGGAMRVGKTHDNLSTTGDVQTFGVQDGTCSYAMPGITGADHFDDWEGDDLKTTVNGTGNGGAVQGFAMNYSCDDLNSAAGASKPFHGGVVNHLMTKTDMDAMFAAQ